MRANITIGNVSVDPKIEFLRHNPQPPPRFGVHVPNDGVVASGPGAFSFSLAGFATLSDERTWGKADSVTLHLEFGVAGAGRSARLTNALTRAPLGRTAQPEQHRRVGHWTIGLP